MRFHNSRKRTAVLACAALLLLTMFVTSEFASQQAGSRAGTRSTKLDGITLTLISHRGLTPDPGSKDKYKGTDIVLVGPEDDLLLRFRLTNRSAKDFYYLKEIYNQQPTGHLLYRQATDDDWRATSPDFGRKGDKGGGYKWELLPPNGWVEVEFSDLSSRASEHAVSVLVNTQPNYTDFVEIISDSYRPMSLPKGDSDVGDLRLIISSGTVNNNGSYKEQSRFVITLAVPSPTIRAILEEVRRANPDRDRLRLNSKGYYLVDPTNDKILDEAKSAADYHLKTGSVLRLFTNSGDGRYFH